MNYDNAFKAALGSIAILGILLGLLASGIATWQFNDAVKNGLINLEAASNAAAWQTIGNGVFVLGALAGIAYLIVASIGYDLYYRSADRVADAKAAAKSD